MWAGLPGGLCHEGHSRGSLASPTIPSPPPSSPLPPPEGFSHHYHHRISIIIDDPYLTTINIPMTTGQNSPSPLPTLFHHCHHDDPITTAHTVLPTLAALPLSSPGVTPITVTTITSSYTIAAFISIIMVTNTTTVATAIITVYHQLQYQHHLHRLHYGTTITPPLASRVSLGSPPASLPSPPSGPSPLHT